MSAANTEGAVRMRVAREYRGLSVTEAAKASGLSTSTIRRLEGKWTDLVRAPTLFAMCDAYGISADWVMGEGPRTPLVLLVDGKYAQADLR